MCEVLGQLYVYHVSQRGTQAWAQAVYTFTAVARSTRSSAAGGMLK